MNRCGKLKQKLGACEKVCGTALTFFNEPLLVDLMNRGDLDFLVFDMEHARFNAESLLPHLCMCRALDVPSLVRVQDAYYHLIAKTVDMGADGIVLPRTETLAQLQAAVDAMYFHPIGRKGCGGFTQFRKGESFDEFQGGRLLFPQIESPKGIETLPAMLDGYAERISGIIVGPYDMSVMVGTPRDIYSDVMLSSIAKVISICNGYKKSVGVFCNDAKEASTYRGMGANIFWLNTDLSFFMDGYSRAFDALAQV
jgi:2-keto-3-deoxy-L-rhamnonate aldolase RhmA